MTSSKAVSILDKLRRNRGPKPPKHLRAATKRWFTQIVEDYTLESHHVMLLTLASEAWDRHLQAREAIAEHGTTFVNNHGDVKPRPEIMIEKDSRNAFMRALREMNLSEEPPDSRPPKLRYGGK
jgi:phage terminase small subunit